MNQSLNKITVSIVSHGHGSMVWMLVNQLSNFEEIDKIIVTLNIPELTPQCLSEKVILLNNSKIKGFGENHNAAFELTDTEFYCVLNPDIKFIGNPFPELLAIFSKNLCGVVAPLIIDSKNHEEDTMRQDITPLRLLRRFLFLNHRIYNKKISENLVIPEWIAGMFMLFRAEVFDKAGGFDERFFMYCEDADICRRIWKIGFPIIGCLNVSVIHVARRASRRNLQHFFWHCHSLIKYLFIHNKLSILKLVK